LETNRGSQTASNVQAVTPVPIWNTLHLLIGEFTDFTVVNEMHYPIKKSGGRNTMGNQKILIVEDDSDVRLGYHILFKVKRYETFFAEDPLSSLAEAHKHRPDLIILDLGLPAGDGFRVMEQLKAVPHLKEIPIVVVSGGDIHTVKTRALLCGAKAYLQKPADNAELLTIISQLIGEPGEEAPHADSARDT
jgi:twitching motility two-component system response regulator PilH